MIQSMTGYGKSVVALDGGRLTVEFRSVNGKNADISIKTSLLPKDKEMELRKKIALVLQRGTIDMFLTWDPDSDTSAKSINTSLVKSYYSQLSSVMDELGCQAGPDAILPTLMRMPDVLDNCRHDIVNEENWKSVEKAIDEALDATVDYRKREGEALYSDVTSRVERILSLYGEVEKLEPERAAANRERIEKAAEELSLKLDPQRLEQEMIFYLEKYDINEEKVRLRQHCRYFMDTIDGEPYPGKKLGFIIQEMGREINTTGSKANHAHIQRLVVQMKDELEKIREQSMNIL